MKISDIDQALEGYSTRKGPKGSKRAWYREKGIQELRRFRKTLLERSPQEDLTVADLAVLSNIIRNKKSKPGRLSQAMRVLLVQPRWPCFGASKAGCLS